MKCSSDADEFALKDIILTFAHSALPKIFLSRIKVGERNEKDAGGVGFLFTRAMFF